MMGTRQAGRTTRRCCDCDWGDCKPTRISIHWHYAKSSSISRLSQAPGTGCRTLVQSCTRHDGAMGSFFPPIPHDGAVPSPTQA